MTGIRRLGQRLNVPSQRSALLISPIIFRTLAGWSVCQSPVADLLAFFFRSFDCSCLTGVLESFVVSSYCSVHHVVGAPALIPWVAVARNKVLTVIYLASSKSRLYVLVVSVYICSLMER